MSVGVSYVCGTSHDGIQLLMISDLEMLVCQPKGCDLIE